MTSDDKRLAEFAAEFAKIPIACRAFLHSARKAQQLSDLYRGVENLANSNRYVRDLAAKLHGIDQRYSGRLAALIVQFAVEMKAEGIIISVGRTRAERLIDAVDYYNSEEVARAAENSPEARIDEAWVRAFDCNLAASGSLKPLDLSALERRVAQWPDEYVTDTNKESYKPYVVGLLNKTNTQPTPEENIMSTFEKFSKKAIAKPTFIFGQLTDDMVDSDYEAAIRNINDQIASFSDIKNSEKVKAKVKVLKESLKEVIELYDAT